MHLPKEIFLFAFFLLYSSPDTAFFRAVFELHFVFLFSQEAELNNNGGFSPDGGVGVGGGGHIGGGVGPHGGGGGGGALRVRHGKGGARTGWPQHVWALELKQ